MDNTDPEANNPATQEFDPEYHATESSYALRRELLHLYFEQGIPGVRERLDRLCPGCQVDLIVAYVVDDAVDLIDAEFAQ